MAKVRDLGQGLPRETPRRYARHRFPAYAETLSNGSTVRITEDARSSYKRPCSFCTTWMSARIKAYSLMQSNGKLLERHQGLCCHVEMRGFQTASS